MSNNRFATDASSWDADPDRNCRGDKPDRWFPTVIDVETGDEYEPPYAPPDVKELCNWCPVRPECLAFALESDQPAGIWAGLSTYERQLIKKPKQRKHCPSCGSGDVIVENRHEVCFGCGISWDIW